MQLTPCTETDGARGVLSYRGQDASLSNYDARRNVKHKATESRILPLLPHTKKKMNYASTIWTLAMVVILQRSGVKESFERQQLSASHRTIPVSSEIRNIAYSLLVLLVLKINTQPRWSRNVLVVLSFNHRPITFTLWRPVSSKCIAR